MAIRRYSRVNVTREMIKSGDARGLLCISSGLLAIAVAHARACKGCIAVVATILAATGIDLFIDDATANGITRVARCE